MYVNYAKLVIQRDRPLNRGEGRGRRAVFTTKLSFFPSLLMGQVSLQRTKHDFRLLNQPRVTFVDNNLIIILALIRNRLKLTDKLMRETQTNPAIYLQLFPVIRRDISDIDIRYSCRDCIL